MMADTLQFSLSLLGKGQHVNSPAARGIPHAQFSALDGDTTIINIDHETHWLKKQGDKPVGVLLAGTGTRGVNQLRKAITDDTNLIVTHGVYFILQWLTANAAELNDNTSLILDLNGFGNGAVLPMQIIHITKTILTELSNNPCCTKTLDRYKRDLNCEELVAQSEVIHQTNLADNLRVRTLRVDPVAGMGNKGLKVNIDVPSYVKRNITILAGHEEHREYREQGLTRRRTEDFSQTTHYDLYFPGSHSSPNRTTFRLDHSGGMQKDSHDNLTARLVHDLQSHLHEAQNPDAPFWVPLVTLQREVSDENKLQTGPAFERSYDTFFLSAESFPHFLAGDGDISLLEILFGIHAAALMHEQDTIGNQHIAYARNTYQTLTADEQNFIQHFFPRLVAILTDPNSNTGMLIDHPKPFDEQEYDISRPEMHNKLRQKLLLQIELRRLSETFINHKRTPYQTLNDFYSAPGNYDVIAKQERHERSTLERLHGKAQRGFLEYKRSLLPHDDFFMNEFALAMFQKTFPNIYECIFLRKYTGRLSQINDIEAERNLPETRSFWQTLPDLKRCVLEEAQILQTECPELFKKIERVHASRFLREEYNIVANIVSDATRSTLLDDDTHKKSDVQIMYEKMKENLFYYKRQVNKDQFSLLKINIQETLRELSSIYYDVFTDDQTKQIKLYAEFIRLLPLLDKSKLIHQEFFPSKMQVTADVEISSDDITKHVMENGVICNAARAFSTKDNNAGGVARAIYNAAGKKLEEVFTKSYGKIRPYLFATAVVTKNVGIRHGAENVCKHIIQCFGVKRQSQKDAITKVDIYNHAMAQLTAFYRAAKDCATSHVATVPIGTGIYKWPVAKVAAIQAYTHALYKQLHTQDPENYPMHENNQQLDFCLFDSDPMRRDELKFHYYLAAEHFALPGNQRALAIQIDPALSFEPENRQANGYGYCTTEQIQLECDNLLNDPEMVNTLRSRLDEMKSNRLFTPNGVMELQAYDWLYRAEMHRAKINFEKCRHDNAHTKAQRRQAKIEFLHDISKLYSQTIAQNGRTDLGSDFILSINARVACYKDNQIFKSFGQSQVKQLYIELCQKINGNGFKCSDGVDIQLNLPLDVQPQPRANPNFHA